MSDTTKSLLEECYEQVYDVSQDPNNAAFAQNLGGVLAVGTTVVAASPLLTTELAPPVAIATAGTVAMGIHSAYNYGAEYGGPVIESVIVPLDATATFAVCAAQEGLIAAKDELVNDIVNIFSEPSSSVPPAQEPLSTPINDGFLVMDVQPPSVFDSPSITTSEEPGPTPSYDMGSISVFDASTPYAYDSTPGVLDTIPTWEAASAAPPDSSSHSSYDTFDSSSNPSSSNSHDSSTGATDS